MFEIEMCLLSENLQINILKINNSYLKCFSIRFFVNFDMISIKNIIVKMQFLKESLCNFFLEREIFTH